MPLVAATRKAKTPVPTGLPASGPVTRLRVNPGGSIPAETENGGFGKPVAVKV
jgi:hypothetical protein